MRETTVRETNTNDCDPIPCENGGTCIVMHNYYCSHTGSS